MGNYFKIHYNAVKYPIDSEKSRGLRNAQLGAIHAISSFFTLNKKDAAIVITQAVRADGSINEKDLEPLMPWSKDLPAECYNKCRK